MATPRIVLNRIRTPDGTVLTSYYRHDYQTYTDKNGHTYMVDGGTDYLRRSVNKEAPAEELSVYADAPFEVIRKSYHWGTNDNGNRVWKPIADLETVHIKAILSLTYASPFMREMLTRELKFREDSSPPPAPVKKVDAKKPLGKKPVRKVV